MQTKPTQYTKDFVIDEVKELLALLKLQPETVFLGELLVEKPYSMQRISEWNSFGGEISETIEKIKDILQTRAVVGGLKNTLNSGMTKFHLINNFDWKDKTETDVTSGGKPLPIYNGLSGHNSNQEDIPTQEED